MSLDEQPQLDIEPLLQRAAQGDQLAWRDIVETFSPRIFGLIRVQCGNPDLAEEITQSTFCTVATKLDTYDEVGKFEAWLFRIALNRLRDEMRRRGRQAVAVEQDTLAALAGGSHASDAHSGSDDRDPTRPAAFSADPDEVAALRLAIEELSDQERRIVHLRHGSELTFRQIAEVLDQPLGTILARHHRARKKLAQRMEVHLPDS